MRENKKFTIKINLKDDKQPYRVFAKEKGKVNEIIFFASTQEEVESLIEKYKEGASYDF